MDEYIGKIAKHDITNSNGTVLVPAKTKITEEHVHLLRNHVVDPSLIPFITGDDQEFRRSMKRTVDTSKELFHSIESSRKVPLLEIRQKILPFVQQAAAYSNVFQLFESVKATDEYTYQHNIAVGIISTLIGRWMSLTESDISILSLAATLHDVGKVKIPVEILNKPGKLSNDEYALVKKHTVYGYELLKETIGLNPRIPLAALQHHERNDGKGYPFGLKEDKIHLFSKIVAVADIFHAMSSKRPYHHPLSFHEIVIQMRKGIFGELDPNIVTVFLDNIMRKIVGERVVLTDGRVGDVVYLNPHHLESPLIKTGDEFIDLSKRNDLHIKEIHI
ncbi:HD-GYP domain-containing protein [Paenibacillus hodogayensis]|uniref:HD-GYP domain-containing protein n=1 Tax=Paenibacillus hodogayensis TaxID=279208 RepID=A0ABV5VX94_9BACL